MDWNKQKPYGEKKKRGREKKTGRKNKQTIKPAYHWNLCFQTTVK